MSPRCFGDIAPWVSIQARMARNPDMSRGMRALQMFSCLLIPPLFMPESVLSQFDAMVAAKPRKIAIFWGNEKISYRDLAARINACSEALQGVGTASARNVAAGFSLRGKDAPIKGATTGKDAPMKGATTGKDAPIKGATTGKDAPIKGAGTGGIVPGDRVGILLKNSPEFIYALYGALKLGATVVPINTFLKPPEIQHIADDCQLKCLISSPDFDEVTGKLQGVAVVSIAQLSHDRRRVPGYGKGVTGDWRPVTRDREAVSQNQSPITNHGSPITDYQSPITDHQSPLSVLRSPPSPSALALIIYTSGTTGKAKGAMLTHANIAANVTSCIKALEETTDDRLTLLLPMFHSFMLTVGIFTPLSMGAGIVLIKSIHPLKAAMREIIMNRATIFIGIPQIFQALADAKIPFWLHWVLKLRLAVSGSAPLPGETLKRFDRKFRFPLLEGYGLSEASPVVSFNPIRGVHKPGSVGLPLPDIEVKIFDDHDHELPAGQVGEIVVRGPNVMRGYYNHEAETAATLRNGWLHTGDMGKKDDDGYIYIVDRRKEMLLVRGMNVYPREIEEVLHKFPNVREVAVVAKPDEKRGEVPVAFVSPAEGAKLEADEILRFLRDHLADYKVPKEVRTLDALPRTPTGKIAKLELKKNL